MDDFAALDAALEQISLQYEEPAAKPKGNTVKNVPGSRSAAAVALDEFDDALDAPPPPVPAFDDEYDPPPSADFGTVRGLDIGDELQEYSSGLQGGTVRGQPAPNNKQDLAKSRRNNAGEAPAAPWGEETLRYSATAAAKGKTAPTVRPSQAPEPAAKQRAQAASHAMILPPVSEEFDLEHPPDEEKMGYRLPVVDPKAKTISVTIVTLDGRSEAIEAVDKWRVEELLWVMGSKLTVWQISFFALSETDPNANVPDRWLDPKRTLVEEGLNSGSRLVFKIKYFKYPKKLRDPMAVKFFYIQTRFHILQGTMEVSEALAFRLASFQMVIQSQTFRPQDLRKGVLTQKLSEWIPKVHLDEIFARGLTEYYVERRIYSAYERVKDMSMQDAQYAYLKAVKDLPLYGSAIFNVSLNGEPRVVGVAEDGILLSQEAQQKLQFFTPRGQIVNRPRYDFTPYEDITKVELGKGTVTIIVLSDRESAHYVLQCTAPAALSMAELICGYRRMLEAYVALSRSFEYPLRVPHPHPALYQKPAKRKKLSTQNSRGEVFKMHYAKLCKETNKPLYEPLLWQVDSAIDTDNPLEELSFSGLRWGRQEIFTVLEALGAAKNYTFVQDEDFIENLRIKNVDFSGNNVLEKGFFADLEKHFEVLGKHPYEAKGVSFRNCRIDDKAMIALRPALTKLKSVERADFSRNALKEDGVHNLILALRDANPGFTDLNLSNCVLHDKKIMKLMAAMLDKNSRLTKLTLCNCNIDDVGVAFLLRGLVNHAGIKSLDLSGNKLGSSKASSDLFVWASRTRGLEEFRMARTEMPNKSSKAVADLLEDPACALKCIDISGNDYGAKGALLILQGLAKNGSLQEVHLGGLDISEKNAEWLMKFLKRNSKTLLVLDIKATPLAKRGLGPVLEELAESNSDKLKTLDIGRMSFVGKGGLDPLVDFVRKSVTLETLIVTGSQFDPDGWAGFLKALQQSKSLMRVEIDQINLAKCSITALRDALRQVPNIREVAMRSCAMHPEQLLMLLQTISHGTNSGLKMIDVRQNDELQEITKHKKYGPALQEAIKGVYLELRI